MTVWITQEQKYVQSLCENRESDLKWAERQLMDVPEKLVA